MRLDRGASCDDTSIDQTQMRHCRLREIKTRLQRILSSGGTGDGRVRRTNYTVGLWCCLALVYVRCTHLFCRTDLFR